MNHPPCDLMTPYRFNSRTSLHKKLHSRSQNRNIALRNIDVWAGKQVSRCSLTNDISFTLPGVSIQDSQDNETSVFTDRATSVYLTSVVKSNTGPWWKLGQGSRVSNLSNVYSSPIIFFSLLIWSGLAQYLIAIGTCSSIQVIFNIHGIAE